MKKNSAFSLVELSIVLLIVGIIIAGIANSSAVVMKMRLSTARGNSKSSPVSGIKDLYAWFDAAAEKSFDDSDMEDGSAVANWYDVNPQYVTRISTTQATSSAKPTYVRKGINNLPVVRFDGGDFLKSSVDYDTMLGGLTGSTFFFVFKPSAVDSQRFLLMQPFGNCTTNIEIGHATGEGASGNFGIHSGCGRATVSPSNTVQNAVAVIMTLVMSPSPLTSGSTANVAIYRDGGSALTLTADVSGYNSGLSGAYGTGKAPIFIGARDSLNNGTVNAYFSGDIGEIIIFDRALGNEERTSVQQYLGKKWVIPVS